VADFNPISLSSSELQHLLRVLTLVWEAVCARVLHMFYKDEVQGWTGCRVQTSSTRPYGGNSSGVFCCWQVQQLLVAPSVSRCPLCEDNTGPCGIFAQGFVDESASFVVYVLSGWRPRGQGHKGGPTASEGCFSSLCS